jgi:hypothetical protein
MKSWSGHMSSLYYPDAFYYKTTFSDKKISTKVDYKEHTDVNTENLKGNLLQAFLLYDTVYMHAWDLPIVIHFFDNRANAELLAEVGLLRLLNCNDYFVACHKNGVLSS